MRHGNAFKRLGRTASHRKAMFRNMVTSLFREESMQTTVDRAKEIRSMAERLIRIAAQDTLHGRRMAYAYVYDKAVVHKLFADIGPRFKNRNGGYTRVIRTGIRHGDSAQLAIIELVEKGAKGAPQKQASTAKGSPKAAAGESKAEPKTKAKAAAKKSETKSPAKKSAAKDGSKAKKA
ncbi:MAG: 50S ribosomal protein L17 [Oligoflexia bacterium]|nr:50S ribosomal protein L17 [Oligoflexia bacterium]